MSSFIGSSIDNSSRSSSIKIQEEIVQILSEFDSFLDNVFETSSTLSSIPVEKNREAEGAEVVVGGVPDIDKALEDDDVVKRSKDIQILESYDEIPTFSYSDTCHHGNFSQNTGFSVNRSDDYGKGDSDQISSKLAAGSSNSVHYEFNPSESFRVDDKGLIERDELIDLKSKSKHSPKLSLFSNKKGNDNKESNDAINTKIKNVDQLKDKERSKSDKLGTFQRLFCTSSSKLTSDSDEKPKLTKPSGTLSKDQISYPILTESTLNVSLIEDRPNSACFNATHLNNGRVYDGSSDRSLCLRTNDTHHPSNLEKVTPTFNNKIRPAVSVDMTQKHKFDDLMKEFSVSSARLKAVEKSEVKNRKDDRSSSNTNFVASTGGKTKSSESLYSGNKPVYPGVSQTSFNTLPLSPHSSRKKRVGNNTLDSGCSTSKTTDNNNDSHTQDNAEFYLLLEYLRQLLSSHSAKIAAGIMSVEHRGTKALELWTRRVTEGYDNVCITNMTTSWRDGLAFCALIHHFRPDLIDFKALKPESILENNALAFRVAEQHLGIPALLDAEDMLLTEIPDRLSILTYVSQFYQAFSALGLIGPGGRRSPISPTVANNAKNTTVTTASTPNKQSSPVIPTSQKAKSISQPPATLQTKTETGFKTDKVLVGTRTRREECAACKKQVFLAERIVVGFPGQLRHRTCFRCDRCAAQLTLASYYETEKGQFCCETCPDEEHNMFSGEDNDDEEFLSISKSGKEGESSSDSEISSDSDLEENSSLTYEERNRRRTPPPPSPRTFRRSRSRTPPPPSPRTVFLKESLHSSQSVTSDNVVPPAKPPRSQMQELSVSNFSQMSPALCGSNSQPPSLDHNMVATSISSEDAKNQEPCPPGNTLDTGQNVQIKNDDDIVSSKTSQNNILPNSDIKDIPIQEIKESKVKSMREIFEHKIEESIETEKDKVSVKTSLKDGKKQELENLGTDNIKANQRKNEESDGISNIKQSEHPELEDEKKSLDNILGSATEIVESYNDDIEDKPNLELPDNVLDNITPSLNRVSSDSALESDNCETHPIDVSDIPSIVVSSENISTLSDEKEIHLGAISDSKIAIDNFDNKNNDNEIPIDKLDSKNNIDNISSNSIDNLVTNDSSNLDTKVVDDSITTISNTEYNEISKQNYPDELNPFDSEEEDDNEKENLSIMHDSNKDQTLVPGKIDKRKVEATPFNPFDTDEDESISDISKDNKEKSLSESAKKKSLNPFWSDEEAEENSSLKKKVKPPRPPPPTLKYETSPNTKKYILPMNPHHDIRPPPSPSLSSKSSSSDQSTLRLKKKLRQAPAPPSPALSRLLTSSTETGEIKDEALSAKLQKDLKNHNSKLRGDACHQRDEASTTVSLKGGISTPKSERGEWRRKKGPAPSRPVPQKRAIRKLPMRQVAQELQDIEVKQTELERQGVILETSIRERTEGPTTNKTLTRDSTTSPDDSISLSSETEKSLHSMNSGNSTLPSMEVEDMILQLFELVNEKNELFRRQTELMYLKREKRLEEEHAELEYQIRCLMLKHPSERTEEDAKIEEELISRLLKVVEQRDAVVNCLEMERQREAIEDESIAKHMIKYQEKHMDGIDTDEERERVAKKKKKKLRLLKKKKKKEKDKEKASKVDADKDIDETEVKKKKKHWFKKSPLSSVI